jgi:hypothetical protein
VGPEEPPAFSVTAGSVRLFDTLRTWELEKLGRIKPSTAMLDELTLLIDAHVEHTTSRPLRTSRFQKQTA